MREEAVIDSSAERSVRGVAAGDVAASLPRRLGRYQLREVLGSGGYATVYLAWDLQLEREVALKLITRASVSRDAVLAEARRAARVEHPNLVAIHEVIDTPEGAAIAMAYIRGVDAAELGRGGPLPAAAVLSLLRQATAALVAAHEAGLVHGDLSPANLMVDAHDHVYIVDFGLAQGVSLETDSGDGATSGHTAGTLAYMAPERLLGRPPTVAADLYALGRIALELLCGQGAVTPAGDALAHAILHGPSPRVPAAIAAADPGLAALIESLLARDPSRRPGSAAVVSDLLAKLSSVAPERWRRWRSHGVPIAWSVAALLLLGAVGLRLLPSPGTVVEVAPIGEGGPTAAALAEVDRGLRRFADAGTLDRVIAELKGMVGKAPRHAAVTADLALAYCLKYADGNRDPVWLARAGAAAEVALASDPNLALAHSASAWVHEFGGNLAAAERDYLAALALDPSDFYAALGHLRLLTRQRRYDEAEAQWSDAAARWPDERLLFDALGNLRYQQADYVAAEHAFRRSLALQPDSPFAYANLNAALLRQGRTEEALAVLQQGLKVRPHPRLYSNLGTALFAAGRYPEAAEAFENAVSDDRGDPGDYLKWANLADALRQLPGRENEAMRAYRRAQQLIEPIRARTPGDVLLLTRSALFAARAGDVRTARERVAALAGDATIDADAAFRLAVVAELGGDRATALARLGSAIALGYPRGLIDSEPDLVGLRRDRRWTDLALTDPPRKESKPR